MQTLYRNLAEICRMRSGGASRPETPTTHSPPAPRLPLEIVEMIVAHLIYDTHSLLACSLTCYSWYIAVVPHLHDTLISPTSSSMNPGKFLWPKQLRCMYKLGLLPLVKKLYIRKRAAYHPDRFSPKCFNSSTLRHLLALTGIQELGIDYLDIPSFMPGIQKYFGHFLPTLRSLSLRVPKGYDWQIIYFIGMFEHLQDLKLLHDFPTDFQEGEPMDIMAPPFAPPLRGRLTLTNFTRVGILEDMIYRFGGIRFRHMDLSNVDGTRLLLGACAETLETLRLYPSDPRGKELSPDRVGVLADNFTVKSSLRDFDLSRSKSLRTLQVAARSIDGRFMYGPSDAPAILLKFALSTIRSPVFSEVTIFYRDYDFRGVQPNHNVLDGPPICRMSPDEMVEDALWHRRRFEVFREMRKVRDFQLVLCADVWDRIGWFSVRVLEDAVAAEKARGGFDRFFSEPMVVFSPRASSPEMAEGVWAAHPCYWVSL